MHRFVNGDVNAAFTHIFGIIHGLYLKIDLFAVGGIYHDMHRARRRLIAFVEPVIGVNSEIIIPVRLDLTAVNRYVDIPAADDPVISAEVAFAFNGKDAV